MRNNLPQYPPEWDLPERNLREMRGLLRVRFWLEKAKREAKP
jgi:hypothetical protein